MCLKLKTNKLFSRRVSVHGIRMGLLGFRICYHGDGPKCLLVAVREASVVITQTEVVLNNPRKAGLPQCNF